MKAALYGWDNAVRQRLIPLSMQSPEVIEDDAASSGKPMRHPSKPIDEKLQQFADKALYAGGSAKAQTLRNFLNGTWLGEPLHIILTDIPIGAWTVALVFDLLEVATGRQDLATAADASIAIGLAGAAGAAITGIADWSDTDPPARRLGMYHGLLNLTGTALFTTSFIFRKLKARDRARIYAVLGFAAIGIAAKLGGKMVYQHRVGVDRTSGQQFPDEFVPVMAASSLRPDTPTRTQHNGVPILLVRRGERVFAMGETCSHFGGPLSEGRLEGETIVCPWHDSRFSLEDGHVIDGPAVHPQPCLAARIRNGRIEVQKSSRFAARLSSRTASETL